MEIKGSDMMLSEADTKAKLINPALHNVHNHPSGDTEPSPTDIELTKRICQACEVVGIKVLDHIIIGKNQEEYFSFAKQGLLK